MDRIRFGLTLIVITISLIYLGGCISENSIEWSDDGSLGVLRVNEALYLVNGYTGELTEIEKQGIQPWPDISGDGTVIAYTKVVDC